DKLWNIHDAAAHSAFLWKGKRVCEWASGNGLLVSQQRIALLCKAVKLGAHHPCVLNELELPLDICIHCHKLESPLNVVGRRGLQRILWREVFAVLPAPAQETMKTGGRDQVSAHILVPESQDSDKV